MLIHIETDSPNSVVNHVKSGIWNRDTAVRNINSRKTACYYCSTGHGPLFYNYGVNLSTAEMFKCHNFACQFSTTGQNQGPRNCDLHGSEEWKNPTIP